MEQKEYVIREVGNALVVTIPTDLARKYNLKKGDNVTYRQESTSIAIERKQEKESNYYDVLDNILEDYKGAIERLIDL